VTLAAALTALALAQGAAGASYAVDPAASHVTFAIRHKLHAVHGRATAVEGRAVVDAEGKVQAMVRIPVAALDTNEANRDANLREAMEAGKYPWVVFKGVGKLALPPPRGTPVRLDLAGELDLHGVRRPLTVPLEVTFDADGSARAKGGFEVSLEAHRVERPSLLLVKIDDACRIGLELVLREEQR
jgi:polyisoprenoid-binding protein YceI